MTKKKTATIQDVYAVLPLRDIVVFPHMIVPLFVGREKSIAALEEVMREDKRILLVAQKNAIRRRSDIRPDVRSGYNWLHPAVAEIA